MSLLTLLIVAIGVSADAFAVSLAQGVRLRRRVHREALRIALTFGLFQALMPLLGWAVGAQLNAVIAPVDHWVAFGLLTLIGGRMLWEAFHSAPAEGGAGRIRTRRLLALALATSIDALAVGLSLAFLDVDILPAVILIGLLTAVLAYGGVLLGHRAGNRWEKPAEIAGGLVLIGIGTKILLEHLLG
ncbi:manganese efflux pump [Microbacterium caowuchunii]|uniref:manganese efflux pump MntP n=1 Tax=Microbacterium caowuchunii TaxID=2614638 RepID=UPI001246F588|nr:manganese efflux pump MntP family protein [Microbacterium caowuchunii]QEW00528.1 manganese efflux pump [Microbacterium caowuchunii]